MSQKTAGWTCESPDKYRKKTFSETYEKRSVSFQFKMKHAHFIKLNYKLQCHSFSHAPDSRIYKNQSQTVIWKFFNKPIKIQTMQLQFWQILSSYQILATGMESKNSQSNWREGRTWKDMSAGKPTQANLHRTFTGSWWKVTLWHLYGLTCTCIWYSLFGELKTFVVLIAAINACLSIITYDYENLCCTPPSWKT